MFQILRAEHVSNPQSLTCFNFPELNIFQILRAEHVYLLSTQQGMVLKSSTCLVSQYSTCLKSAELNMFEILRAPHV